MEDSTKQILTGSTELDNNGSNNHKYNNVYQEEEENTIVELTLDIPEEDEEDEGDVGQQPENQPPGSQPAKAAKRSRREKLMDKLRQLEVDPYFYESDAAEKARNLYNSYVNDYSLELLDNEDYIEILKKKKGQRVRDVQNMSIARIEAENEGIKAQIVEIDAEIEKLTEEIKKLKKKAAKSEKKREEITSP